MYVVFKQQSDATASCMHVTSMDGGHLKHPLWGNYQVLVLSTYIGENNLTPLAFAIAPGENSLSY